MNMSNKRQVVVTIDRLGNPKVEAQNFMGASCEAATANIEKALGGASGGVTRELKGEYYADGVEQTNTETQSWA